VAVADLTPHSIMELNIPGTPMRSPARTALRRCLSSPANKERVMEDIIKNTFALEDQQTVARYALDLGAAKFGKCPNHINWKALQEAMLDYQQIWYDRLEDQQAKVLHQL
jgi:hypothetical protein